MTADPPTIAITGAAGYIGSRIVDQLQAVHPEWSITALDNFSVGDIGENGDVVVESVDVRDRPKLGAALEGADIVMHLAAISGVDGCDDDPELAFDVNVRGTENVAMHCRESGAALVFPFSMASIGDPVDTPISADHPREPLNWYGRTKYLGELTVDVLADGAFPAHVLMKSNAYGEHAVGVHQVSKPTVVNFFVDRALADEPLTVYEPGTQARNYLHVKDAARAYLRSAERLLEQLAVGETGASTFEIASDDDPGVLDVAERVRDAFEAATGEVPSIELVENPRGNETTVDVFAVDTTRARTELGWAPRHDLDESIAALVEERVRSRPERERKLRV